MTQLMFSPKATLDDQRAHKYTTTIEWNGFAIRPIVKDKPWIVDGHQVTAGFEVSELGINPIPGAAWFATTAEAQKAIAALVLSRQTGGDFWMFMELTK